MKAIVYSQPGAPEVFRYEDVADPVCGPKDVKIEVKAIAIEGGDVLARAFIETGGKDQVVGYSAAGVIAELGEWFQGRRSRNYSEWGGVSCGAACGIELHLLGAAGQCVF